MEKKFARLLQLILVTFIIFIFLDDTSELRTLEVRFLNDPENSKLFEEPESDSEHKQEYEQEPAPRKRKPQPNKKAAKKAISDEASSERKKKKKNPELVSTVVFTSFSNSLDCGRQDIIVHGRLLLLLSIPFTFYSNNSPSTPIFSYLSYLGLRLNFLISLAIWIWKDVKTLLGCS